MTASVNHQTQYNIAYQLKHLSDLFCRRRINKLKQKCQPRRMRNNQSANDVAYYEVSNHQLMHEAASGGDVMVKRR